MRAPLALVALVVAACPPPPDPIVDAGPDDRDPDLTATTYCESIVDFFCPFYVRCGRMAVADADACRPVFLEACEARFEPSYVSLEAAGFSTLSTEGVDACRAHLDTVACDQQVLDLDGPCSTMWVGAQPAGAACGFDIETFVCAPGSACTLDLSLCGVCERVVADGADCTTDGVTCARESSCEDGVCVARRRVGESCGPEQRCVLGALCTDDLCVGPSYVGAGDACDFESRCPYATRCLDGSCRSAVALGATCDPFAPCDSGYCDGDVDQCVALVPQGGACTESDECQTGVCTDASTCASLPSVCL